MLSITAALLFQADYGSAVERLASPDVSERVTAKRLLLEGGVKAIPSILKRLDTSDSEMRSRIHEILFALGLPAAVAIRENGEVNRTLINQIHLNQARHFLEASVHDLSAKEIVPPVVPIPWGVKSKFEFSLGEGHGHSLDWWHLGQNGKGEIRILNINSSLGNKRYSSKWPPRKEASLTVRSGMLSIPLYEEFLCLISVIAGTSLRTKGEHPDYRSSRRFSCSVKVDEAGKMNWKAAYAGYRDAREEESYFRLLAAFQAIEKLCQQIDIRERNPAQDDRELVMEAVIREASDRLMKDNDLWIGECASYAIGKLGSKEHIPVLLRIIEKYPAEGISYWAIDAVCNLLGEDIRDSDPENMNIQAASKRLMDLCRQRGIVK